MVVGLKAGDDDTIAGPMGFLYNRFVKAERGHLGDAEVRVETGTGGGDAEVDLAWVRH